MGVLLKAKNSEIILLSYVCFSCFASHFSPEYVMSALSSELLFFFYTSVNKLTSLLLCYRAAISKSCYVCHSEQRLRLMRKPFSVQSFPSVTSDFYFMCMCPYYK